MKISVNYEDTDVAKALGKIIKDSNSEEFIKLLTPMLCSSSQATECFFKLMIGNKLEEPIPNGTLCKIPVKHLGWGINETGIREKFADEDDKIIVTVKEFRGYHEYSQYAIEFTDVLNDNINTKKSTTYVKFDDLEIIEEF